MGNTGFINTPTEESMVAPAISRRVALFKSADCLILPADDFTNGRNTRGKRSPIRSNEKCSPVVFRRQLGMPAKSSYQEVVTTLCDHHREPNELVAQLQHTRLACSCCRRKLTCLAFQGAGKKSLRTVSLPTNMAATTNRPQRINTKTQK